MKRKVCLLVALLVFTGPLWAGDCSTIVQELKLPRKMKTRGKPKAFKWEEVDKLLSQVSQMADGQACRFTAGQLFAAKNDDVQFPLTNSVIRIAPEDTFADVPVLTKEGEALGKYLGRVKYERSGGLYATGSYELYYFQYENTDGERFTVGNRLLLGDYLVPWKQVKDLVIFDSQTSE